MSGSCPNNRARPSAVRGAFEGNEVPAAVARSKSGIFYFAQIKNFLLCLDTAAGYDVGRETQGD